MDNLSIGPKDHCVQCGISKTVIQASQRKGQRHRIFCANLDPWGEAIQDWERHKFTWTEKDQDEWDAYVDFWVSVANECERREAERIERIVTCLQSKHYTFSSEKELQAELHNHLLEQGFASRREVRLSEAIGTIDLMVGDVGIEVKTAGRHTDVTRQLIRYSEAIQIGSLILVTTKAKHSSIPRTLSEKPVRVIGLWEAGL